jgi:hypothetical protein
MNNYEMVMAKSPPEKLTFIYKGRTISYWPDGITNKPMAARLKATPYTGMKAAKPADYEKAAHLLWPQWETQDWQAQAVKESLRLANSKPGQANWIDDIMGFAERVRYAEVLAGGTVYSPVAIILDAEPQNNQTHKEIFAQLKRYHRYILPYDKEQLYKKLRKELG